MSIVEEIAILLFSAAGLIVICTGIGILVYIAYRTLEDN